MTSKRSVRSVASSRFSWRYSISLRTCGATRAVPSCAPRPRSKWRRSVSSGMLGDALHLVDAGARDPERLGRQVGGEQPHLRRRRRLRGKRVEQRHRDRVRLLAGRARRAPDPDRPPARAERRHAPSSSRNSKCCGSRKKLVWLVAIASSSAVSSSPVWSRSTCSRYVPKLMNPPAPQPLLQARDAPAPACRRAA